MSATNKKDKYPENPTLEQFEGFKEELRATVQVIADRQSGYMAKLNGIEDNIDIRFHDLRDIQENMRESMAAMENRLMAALERFYRDPPKTQTDNTSTATPADEDIAQSDREEKGEGEDYTFEEATGRFGQTPHDSGEASAEDPRDSGVTNRSIMYR
jgi:hypothetical protein